MAVGQHVRAHAPLIIRTNVMSSRSGFRFSLCIVLAVAMLFVFQSCSLVSASTLSADPIDSQVVDADTGKPIHGVIVVAYWELHQGSLGGDALPCAAANVEEAVTDKDGKFHVPGWGPIKGHCGYMRGGDPLMFIFKPGYYYNQNPNTPYGTDIVTVTHNGWKGRQMKLKKFPDVSYSDMSPTAYIWNVSQFNIALSFITDFPTQCNWRRVPNTLRTLELEGEKFRKALGYPVGVITGQLITNDKWFEKVAPQCGSPKVFLEGLMK